MEDRERELERLVERIRNEPGVIDAWTAKSFTDRLLIIDIKAETELSGDLREQLASHGLRGYNEVHDTGAENSAFAGGLERGDRYQFVDIESRGELQSYVI